jgi:hypothetical protein
MNVWKLALTILLASAPLAAQESRGTIFGGRLIQANIRFVF